MTSLHTLPVLAAALLVLSATTLHGQAAETVTFDGRTLVLASNTSSPGESIREFIPADEELEAWTILASIREFPKLTDPKRAAFDLIRVLRSQNPEAPSDVIENPATGDVIVDFITWPADRAFVEFNIFRYSRSSRGGLVAQQFALRAYDDQADFLTRLKSRRPGLIESMARTGLILSR